jgi:NAD(P)-dependent dehydrogenase (short-subunit alcohol dehydrogenase family)
MQLEGKTALITGASRGLGRAVAAVFSGEGARCALVARDPERLGKVARELSREGVKHIACPAEISEEEAVEAAVRSAVEEFGKLDILVHCAAEALIRPIQEMSADEWDRIFRVNARGCFLVSRAVIRHMLEKGTAGRIILVSSVSGKTGAPGISAYAASKFAVIGFMQSLSKELSGKGITVNAVCPGAMDTDMLHRDTVEVLARQANVPREDMLNRYLRALPMKRLLKPEEVARMMLVLASDEGRCLNGQALNIDGGMEMH